MDKKRSFCQSRTERPPRPIEIQRRGGLVFLFVGKGRRAVHTVAGKTRKNDLLVGKSQLSLKEQRFARKKGGFMVECRQEKIAAYSGSRVLQKV